MKYKLMIKTHNVTKLKYLCVTSKENYEMYKGSGYYWKRHLEIHGKDILTELLFETDNLEELTKRAIEYSSEFDVVESDEWANLIPESGYHVTEPEKQRNGWFGWYSSLSCEEKEKRNKNISKKVKERLLKIKDELPSILSERRKKLSTEKKEQRKKKIQEIYATGKHDDYFKRLSEERKGAGNPMYGVNIWKDRKPVCCPHCRKTMKDSPAARRWHFDYCKEKGVLDEN